MKRSEDKELQAVCEQSNHESVEAGDNLTSTLRIEQLLEQISNEEKYRYRVFYVSNIYFIIANGCIKTISADAGYLPNRSCFPAIVTGPTEKERESLQRLMNTLGFDEISFSELIEYCEEFDEDDIDDFFTENDDEELLKIYRKVERNIKTGKTPFETMVQFFSALARFELDDDLYYKWEGEYIHFYNDICDVGEAPGSYDNISTADWVQILENLDSHFVTAD